MRKIFLFVFYMIIFISKLFSFSNENIVGVWIPKEIFKGIFNNPFFFRNDEDEEERLPKISHVYGFTTILPEKNYIFYYENDILKCNFDAHPFIIENLAWSSKNSLTFEIYDILFNQKILIDTITINFISDNEICFLGKMQTWKIDRLIKVSTSAKIPIQPAIVNDSRIRVRTLPNLNSDTWGYLNTGDCVKIKDKSSEPMEIDGESWYWYKVESENLPDGWVYGKYLDIENE